jgi:hypothetical protein
MKKTCILGQPVEKKHGRLDILEEREVFLGEVTV